MGPRALRSAPWPEFPGVAREVPGKKTTGRKTIAFLRPGILEALVRRMQSRAGARADLTFSRAVWIGAASSSVPPASARAPPEITSPLWFHAS